MNGRIEPEWAMVTVLFVDIRDVTAFADRASGEPLLLTEATRRLLESGGDGLEPRGEPALKSKRGPVTVYPPLGVDV